MNLNDENQAKIRKISVIRAQSFKVSVKKLGVQN